MTTAPQRRIPSLRLARHAYLDLVGSWRGLVQIGGLWLILPWVLDSLDTGLLELAGDLLLTAGIAAIAVAWHRRLLLDEALPARVAPLTNLVGRYLGFSVLVVGIAAVPSFLLAILLTGIAADGGEVGLLAAGTLSLVALFGLLAAMRLQLVFPAVAINERAVTLATSWRVTQGNAWRLLLGVLLVSLPPALAGTALAVGLDWLADTTGSLILGWLARLAPIAGAWTQAPLLAAFLSFVYLYLREQMGVQNVPALTG